MPDWPDLFGYSPTPEEDERPAPDGPGYVYLIRFHFYQGGKCYKIGYSTDPDKRFKQLKAALPGYSELEHVIRTDDMAGAESYMHKEFEQKRIHGSGEWFDLDRSDVEDFLEIIEINYWTGEKGLSIERDDIYVRHYRAQLFREGLLNTK